MLPQTANGSVTEHRAAQHPLPKEELCTLMLN
jgi:hypothetical protein